MLLPFSSIISNTLCFQALSHPVASQSTSSATVFQAKLIHQFDPSTWVENLAVRPNGFLLPITTTSPVLNQVNSNTGELQLVHDFSTNGNAIQGITEVVPDVFAVNVLTCNILGNLSCTPGSTSTWRVDLRGNKFQTPVQVKKVAEFPTAGFLNGMANLPGSPGTVIIADSYKGGIWSLNMWTGQNELVFTDASMMGTATIPTGINGIRVQPGVLYFTNSALGTFNSLAIDTRTAQKAGNATVITSGLIGPDDFEIDAIVRRAYLCNGAANQLLEIALSNGSLEEIAELSGPTSARWSARRHGREKLLYVSTNGGLLEYVEHNVTLGGAVYSISIG